MFRVLGFKRILIYLPLTEEATGLPEEASPVTVTVKSVSVVPGVAIVQEAVVPGAEFQPKLLLAAVFTADAAVQVVPYRAAMLVSDAVLLSDRAAWRALYTLALWA